MIERKLADPRHEGTRMQKPQGRGDRRARECETAGRRERAQEKVENRGGECPTYSIALIGSNREPETLKAGIP